MESWYLDCLRRWVAQRGKPPSCSALAGWVGKSKTAVYSAMVSLEHKGYVTRIGAKAMDGDKRRGRFFVPVAVAS